MSDAIVITCYRSPLTCASRIKLLRALDPGCQIFVAYTGCATHSASFGRVFDLADDYYQVPTINTKDNWYGLDRALAQWWMIQGKNKQLTRLLFLDWDALLLDPPSRLLDQLTDGRALFSHAFPVCNFESDHWAREFVALNPLFFNDSERSQQNPLMFRTFLFAWACFASDFEKAVPRILEMNGFCEVRLPFAFQANGISLEPFQSLSLEVCNVFGEGHSLSRLRTLQTAHSSIFLAHPVYLPVCSQNLRVNLLAWFVEAPYLKSLLRRLKKVSRRLLVRVGLLASVNP